MAEVLKSGRIVTIGQILRENPGAVKTRPACLAGNLRLGEPIDPPEAEEISYLPLHEGLTHPATAK